MALDEIQRLASAMPRRVRAVYALVLTGLAIEMVALAIGAYLGVSAGEYWGTAKSVRDGAAAGTDLLAQGGTIAAVSTWLTPLWFVGIAIFFSGIALALSAIVPSLQLRARAIAALVSATENPEPSKDRTPEAVMVN